MHHAWELFVGMVVVACGYYLDVSYYFLEGIVLLWWYYRLENKEVILLCFLAGCFWGLNLLPISPFQMTNKGEITYISDSGFQVGNTFYQAYDLKETLSVGDIVKVVAEQQDFTTMNNDGSFDNKHFLMGKGIKYVASLQSYEIIDHHWHLQEALCQLIEKHIHPQLKDAYLYLLVGVKQEDTEQLLALAKDLAILHLLAISGMHFSLLQKYLDHFLGLFLSKKPTQMISFLVMGIYAVALGKNIAAWRAYLTKLLHTYTDLSPLNCLGLVGILFLVINPQVIFNMAFIYAFAIYFFVLLCLDIKHSSFYIYLGTLGLACYFQYEINPIGIIFAYVFEELLTLCFPLWILDVLSLGKLGLCNLFLYHGLKQMMTFFGHLSFTIITGRPPVLLVLLYCFTLTYAIYQTQFYHCQKYFIYPIILFTLILFLPNLRPYGKVTMVDVGQGDCFVIQLPFQKASIMIDTGGLRNQDVATKRLIPFLKANGISHLDTIYISHDDYDHCGALDSLQENFSVKEVITDFTQTQYGNYQFTQLNQYPSTDTNQASQVIYTQLGNTSYLFTGDIDTGVEAWLLEHYPDLKADVLKVSHHGSQTATSADFVSQINPKVALISVGKNNLYHHPSPSVLSRLEAYGCKIYQSSLNGQVTVYFTKHHTWIES